MRTILTLALAFFFTSSAFGEELKLYAAAGVKAPLLTLAAEYEAATGHKVTIVFDTAGATNKLFLANPEGGLLITTQTLISEGEKSGRLKDGISARLGDTVAGLAGPPDQETGKQAWKVDTIALRRPSQGPNTARGRRITHSGSLASASRVSAWALLRA